MNIMAALNIANIRCYDIDPEVFPNPFIEAATRLVEDCRNKPDVKIGATVECWMIDADAQTPPPIVRLNMYHILLNAGRPDAAKRLQEGMLAQFSIDLAKEPIASVTV